MAVSKIPDDHSFVKHCANKKIIRENGAVIGVYPEAFELRPPTANFPQEKTLSGMYYDHLDGSHFDKMHACFHFIPLEMKPKDALLRMNAGLIRAQGQKRSKPLRVIHEPNRECCAYASIRGMPVQTDDELCGLLKTFAVTEIVAVAAFR